jgi:hypothetical protein
MNTTDLPALLRECVDGNAEPVSFGEIKARAELTGHAERRVPARRRTLLGTAGAGLTAAGIAGALVATQSGGGGISAVLTAAMLKHVASASQAAMTSGQADIDWTSAGLPSVRQQVTFDGANWNDVDGTSISRVVNGRDFHYPAFTRTAHGMGTTPGWMLVLAPGAAPSLEIPDPRTLLSVLSPAAGFVADGYTTEDGVRLEHLRATTPGAVSLTPLNPLIQSEPDGARVSALDLWVDPSDVVLRARITVHGTGTTQVLTPAGRQALKTYLRENGIKYAGPLQGVPEALVKLKPGVATLLRKPGMVTDRATHEGNVTVSVRFSKIGQPQTITAPAQYSTWGDGRS